MTISEGGSGNITEKDTAGRSAVSTSAPVGTNGTVSISGLPNVYTVTWETISSVYSSQYEQLGNGSNDGCNFTPNGGANISVIKSIELPNGTYYTFGYDSYGLLNQITYPTGAVVNYTRSIPSSPNGQINFFPPYPNNQFECDYAYYAPMVTQRTVMFDGVHTALAQNFSYTTAYNAGVEQATVQTTVYSSDGTTNLGTFKTVYNYFAASFGVSDPDDQVVVATPIPVEQTVQYYDYGQTNLLETVTKAWQDQFLLGCQLDTHDGTGLRGTFYSYGAGGVVTAKNEYDYGQVTTSQCPQAAEGGPITPPSGQTRETATTYQVFGNTPIYPTASILDRPCSVIIKDSSGNRAAETDYEYDGGTSVCGTAGTSSVANASSPVQHDPAYAYTVSPQPPRGNATTVTRQCIQSAPACSSGNPATAYAYDETGQATSMKDPNSNTTTYAYADSYTSGTPPGQTNAYLTKVTQPTTNGVAHIESYSHSYADGQLTKSVDQNNQPTTYTYNTPPTGCSSGHGLDRVSTITYPDTGTTTYCYNDTAPTPTVTTQKLISSGNYLTNVTTMDGLGHVTETQLTSDPEGTDSSATVYDGLGHAYKQYNATRCSTPTTNCGTDPTWGLTTSIYDALGRTTIFVPQDGTVPTGSSCPSNDVCTTYSGSTTTAITTVTDEAGISRKSVTDGLGRLKQVFEAPSGVDYETDYAYDALDDLLCVAQKGTNSGTFTSCASTPASWRLRSFAYNSLSQLTTSQNPEISNPSTGAICPVTYTYDANGNLLIKTSPEPNQTSCPSAQSGTTLTTTYTYDADNRMAEKSYSDSTLPAYFYYDQSSGSGFTLSNTNGRVSSEGTYTGSSWLTAAMIGYDPMGRTNLDAQCTTANTSSNWCSWAPTYFYNQIGGITSYGNSAGTTLSQTFDNAGRATQLTSSWNDSGHPATLVTVASNVGYWSDGPLRLATFANGLTEDTLYNPRLQLCRMNINSWDGVLTTCTQSATGSNIDFTMTYNYGTGDNGNVFNMSAIGGQTFNRTYTYDSVNRISTMADSATGQPCKGLQWTIDAWGNRTAQTTTSGTCITSPTLAVNNNNQITGSPYQYDAAGNMTHDANHSYTYDAENHIISVDAGSTATYVYDAEGRRVQKTSGGVTLNYTYDLGGNVVAERSSSCSYCLTTGYNYFDGALNSIYTSSTTYFVHTDHLGSTRLVTGYPTPNTVECDDYYPYGELNTSGCSQSAAITHKFTGKERDSESNLDNFLARYDSSSLGRFLSPDWAAAPEDVPYANFDNPQSLNLYAYVENNPLSAADADGHTQVCSGDTYSRDEHGNVVVHANCTDVPDFHRPPKRRLHLEQDIAQRRLGHHRCDTGCQGAWLKLGADLTVMAGLLSGDPPLEEEGGEGEIEAEKLLRQAGAEAEADATAAQMKRLSGGEIDKLQKNGIDPHELKPNSKYDLFKDNKGNIYVKPKSGEGPGEPTGLNINDYK